MYHATLFLLLSLAAFAVAADLYKILDVASTASDRDIRHAYKKLSRMYHPDKNQDPEAEGKFVDIAHGMLH
jgi:DnaJ-related protein SCJ1